MTPDIVTLAMSKTLSGWIIYTCAARPFLINWTIDAY
jgi:hypothetical protein